MFAIYDRMNNILIGPLTEEAARDNARIAPSVLHVHEEFAPEKSSGRVLALDEWVKLGFRLDVLRAHSEAETLRLQSGTVPVIEIPDLCNILTAACEGIPGLASAIIRAVIYFRQAAYPDNAILKELFNEHKALAQKEAAAFRSTRSTQRNRPLGRDAEEGDEAPVKRDAYLDGIMRHGEAAE